MKQLANTEITANRARPEGRGACRGGPRRAVVVVPFLREGERKEDPFNRSGKLSLPERLSEAVGLAKAIGLDVRFAGSVGLAHARPATLLGAGKVEELAGIVAMEEAEVVIVDHALTPVQQRNLETAWNAKVLDRTGLILEIFADRAQSREGRLQVELARLTYQKSRLVRSWTHLERQRGGFGFLGGPGETQIEADRRVIGERIDVIRGELATVERTRRLHRKRRRDSNQEIVSLVGYTNAGKSTLFNALSGADAVAKDMLFATLDPTLRRVRDGAGFSYILSDTVGFVSELPTQLIAAFRSTLEEIIEADLILHVRDIASPTSEAQAHEVRRVLAEIGIGPDEQARRVVEVWNKSDLLGEDERKRLARHARARDVPAVLVSAARGEGLERLRAVIGQRLKKRAGIKDVVVSPENGRAVHWLYQNAEVLDRRDGDDGTLHFKVRVAPDRMGDLERHLLRTV